jgi:hypothetical protein
MTSYLSRFTLTIWQGNELIWPWSWTSTFWFDTICMLINIIPGMKVQQWFVRDVSGRKRLCSKRLSAHSIKSELLSLTYVFSFCRQTIDSTAHDFFVPIFKVIVMRHHYVTCFVNNVLSAISFLCAVLVPIDGKWEKWLSLMQKQDSITSGSSTIVLNGSR